MPGRASRHSRHGARKEARGAGRRGQRGSAATERLRRLRLGLTILFTAINTVGLLLLGPLIVHQDHQRRMESQDAELRRVASTVPRLIRVAGNAVDLSLVPTDPLYRACPRFAIVSSDDAFRTYRNKGSCGDLGNATLDRLTTRAVAEGDSFVTDVEGPHGEPLRVAVEPYAESGRQYAGAVVVWSDTSAQQASHRRVLLLVLAGCLVLVGGVALAGYWLAGRAIRPAVAALEQQEVLLAETAHDLRTPVAALRSLAETAARDPSQGAELLPRTVRLAGRMGDIIDGLLIRARLAAGVEQLSMQPLWLDQLVAAVVEDIPHGDASVSVITAPSKVLADRVLVERAVGNLVDNALRYGRAPGEQAVVTVTVADGRVTVADRGPGFDPELTDEAAFARFTSARGSSGLGLSIVRWVAEAHGGRLIVHDSDEGGAILEFTLPPTPDR